MEVEDEAEEAQLAPLNMTVIPIRACITGGVKEVGSAVLGTHPCEESPSTVLSPWCVERNLIV